MSELVLRTERWGTFWPEAEPLFAIHRSEVGDSSPAPLRVDWRLAEQLDLAGALLIQTARSEGLLAGYCIWYISPSLESAGLLVGSQGPWFVLPEHRTGRAAVRLLKESLGALRARGVLQALPHHWMGGAGPRLGPLFERLGARPLEITYSLWLGD